MSQDIAKVLSFEIKKEIADRYFGFRKMIEDDKAELSRQVHRHGITIEQKLCLSLSRIYILLQDYELIVNFLALTGLEEGVFYDPYIPESPTLRKKVFAGLRLRGLTRTARFKNLLFDEYDALVDLVEEHRERYEQLEEEQEVISEEILLFYKKNDLSNIMGFLRGLEDVGGASQALVPPTQQAGGENMANKMRIKVPGTVDKMLPLIRPLIPRPQIRRQLKALAVQALQIHGQGFFASLK